jgi:tetratricopeptide (TPR) repeat protein
MMSRKWHWGICGIAILLLSCATDPRVYKDIDAGVRRGSYGDALSALEEGQSSGIPVYPPKNIIMYYLDKGVLEHYAGRYRESAEDLEEAERLIYEAYTKSVTQDIASYVANDNTRDYPGEDYEDIYVNVFSALNYYHRGDTQGAMVEIRKLTEKLDYLSAKYAADFDKVREYGRENNAEIPAGKTAALSDSALARYLSALFYRGSGLPDDARLDFVQLWNVYHSVPSVYSTPLPASLELSGVPGRETNEELAVPGGKARLNALCFAGLSPVKTEEKIYGPYGTRVALPRLTPRPSSISHIQAEVEGGPSFNLELLEDMGAVMAETFKIRYSVIVAKTFIRTIMKYAVSAAGGAAVSEAADNELLGFGVALLGKIVTDASESADIRSSRYFPGRAYVGGVTLEPGVYNITVNFYQGHSLLESVKRPGVKVEAGKTNIIEAFSLR